MDNFLTRAWRRILGDLHLAPASTRLFACDEPVAFFIDELAQRERRSPDEVAAELLSQAVAERQLAERRMRMWRQLSRREQDVTALACLGFSGQEIAERLVISSETVKSHLRSATHKFSLRRRAELRQALANWDFSDWLEPRG
jgi:DNA-binding CsgD family transcriptional regulator